MYDMHEIGRQRADMSADDVLPLTEAAKAFDFMLLEANATQVAELNDMKPRSKAFKTFVERSTLVAKCAYLDRLIERQEKIIKRALEADRD